MLCERLGHSEFSWKMDQIERMYELKIKTNKVGSIISRLQVKLEYFLLVLEIHLSYKGVFWIVVGYYIPVFFEMLA